MKAILKCMMLLSFLFVGVASYAQVNKWRDIYKVKKKDTIFGIARQYNVTLPELMDANPEMKVEGYELKKGDTIFIPYSKGDKSQAVGAAEAAAAQKNVSDADVTRREIRVGVMLPLHDVDGDGRRMVEYYRGMLMAMEDLKAAGISVQVHAWNVPVDADIRTTLLEDAAKRCDIIFGPLYTPQVRPLANFCRANGIKLVIPFSISGNDVASNANIYQVYQAPDKLNDVAINAYLDRFPSAHPVFIDCNDATSNKGAFTFGLRKQLEAKGIKYNITNLNSSEEYFAKSFEASSTNVVILNTGRSPELNAALAKLDRMRLNHPNIKMALFGYTEWLMYTSVYTNYFHKYDTYIPTNFYYNAQAAATQQLEQRYKTAFGSEMQYALPRFAITGYDQAQFFLRGLHQYGKAFVGTRRQKLAFRPIQTSLAFQRVGTADGGMQNTEFMLVHYKTDGNSETISY